jgi:pimeloyl-ACP methyl ester carboxylesterase
MTALPAVDHHTARLNGIKIHWVTAGSGPPVYLLHGFPETWFAWRKQIARLAESFTVVAPDLRGYGATDKPVSGYDKRTMANDVLALMDHLGHERIALVGHDRGARVATRFAKDHASRLDRLVVMENIPTRILAENASNPTMQAAGWFTQFFNVPDLSEALIAGKERELLSFFYRTWSYSPDVMTPDEIDIYVREYERPGSVRGFCSDYRARAEDVAQDTEDKDVLISCPVLSLWGLDSEAVGQAFDVKAVWQTMASDLTTVAVEKCGHLPHEEQPEIVNDSLASFLATWTG